MTAAVRVGVLMGGTSAEREVSLNSGKAVSGALRSRGYDVVDVDVGADVAGVLGREDVGLAFIALHGGTGEDGSIQGMLEVMGVPYTGSGVLASAMAMDKLVSKILFSANGIPVPGFEAVEPGGYPQMRPPVVVKPVKEGSSIGVSIVRDEGSLKDALEHAHSFGGIAIVEEYISGKEVQIGILGDRVLGGVEVRPSLEFYSYEAKYTSGLTEYVLPPELDSALYERACSTALRAHRALRCSGATRVDLLIDAEETVYALEVNTIPGMTETSLLPKIAGQAGMDFPTVIEEMVKDALERGGRKR
jgi:D-alanine-D-alanine ligase